MSEFLKQRASQHSSASSPKSPQQMSEIRPWYGCDEIAALSREKERDALEVDTSAPSGSQSGSKRERSELLDGVEQLEHVVSSFESICANEEPTEKAAFNQAGLDELNTVISQVEALVKSVQAENEHLSAAECSSCTLLRHDNDRLRGKVSELEGLVGSYESRIETMENDTKHAKPDSPPSPAASGLLTASMRLRNVTAALNKALYTKK